jgi:hypothetical protein
MRQATRTGGDVLVVAGAETEKCTEFIVSSTERFYQLSRHGRFG